MNGQQGLLNMPGQRTNPYQGYFQHSPMQNPMLQSPTGIPKPDPNQTLLGRNKYQRMFEMGMKMGMLGRDLKKWLAEQQQPGTPAGAQYEPLTQGSYSGGGYYGSPTQGLLTSMDPGSPVLY